MKLNGSDYTGKILWYVDDNVTCVVVTFFCGAEFHSLCGVQDAKMKASAQKRQAEPTNYKVL